MRSRSSSPADVDRARDLGVGVGRVVRDGVGGRGRDGGRGRVGPGAERGEQGHARRREAACRLVVGSLRLHAGDRRCRGQEDGQDGVGHDSHCASSPFFAPCSSAGSGAEACIRTRMVSVRSQGEPCSPRPRGRGQRRAAGEPAASPQALTGIAALEGLRNRTGAQIWPFETLGEGCSHVLAEIYPSLIEPNPGSEVP